jgi:hypothetical protein
MPFISTQPFETLVMVSRVSWFVPSDVRIAWSDTLSATTYP